MSRLPLTARAHDEPIAHRDGDPVAVGRFLAEVEALATRLPQRPFAINLCRDRYRFSRAFAAVMTAGQTNLLPANRLDATIRDLLAEYPDAYVLSDEDRDRQWPSTCDAREVQGAAATATGVPEIPAEHRAAVVFTSGSTGRARAIDKPWHTYHASTLGNAAEMGLADGGPRHLLATVPPQHMYGLETSVLVPLFAPVAASSAQPFMPADIAASLRALPIPRILVSTPAHLRALADPGLDLPAIEAVWSATGPLDPVVAKQIEDLHGTRLSEIYGCSEVGSMARRQPVRDPVWTLFRDFTLTAEADGHTRASAPHLPASFVLQDWLEHVGPGRFRVTGRTEDLINVAGKRASLVELNQTLLRIPGVSDGVMFEPPARSDARTARLAALVVAPGLRADEIRAALREHIDDAFLPRPIRLVERLPRAETGKLPRQAVLDAYHAAAGVDGAGC